MSSNDNVAAAISAYTYPCSGGSSVIRLEAAIKTVVELMAGFPLWIVPLAVVLSRPSAPAIARSCPPAFLESSVGLGWPSLTADFLVAFNMLSVGLSVALYFFLPCS